MIGIFDAANVGAPQRTGFDYIKENGERKILHSEPHAAVPPQPY